MSVYQKNRLGIWEPINGDMETPRILNGYDRHDDWLRPWLLTEADCDECRNRTDDCILGSDSCRFEEL